MVPASVSEVGAVAAVATLGPDRKVTISVVAPVSVVRLLDARAAANERSRSREAVRILRRELESPLGRPAA